MADSPEFHDREWTRDRLLAMLDGISALLTLWDGAFRCRFANRLALADWGRTQESVSRVHLSTIVGQDAFEHLSGLFDRVLTGETLQVERVTAGPDGAMRHYQGTMTPFVDDGQVQGVAVIDVDVNPLAEVESAVRIAGDRAYRLAERQRITAELDYRAIGRLGTVLTVLTALTDAVTSTEPPGDVDGVVEALDDCIDEFRSVAVGTLARDDGATGTDERSTGITDTGRIRAVDGAGRDGSGKPAQRSGRASWAAEDCIAFLDQLPVIATAWDAQQRNTFSNQAALAWYGRTDRAGVTGQHMQDLLKPEYYEPEIAMVHQALAGVTQEHRRAVTDPAGRLHNLQVTHAPIREDGTVAGSFVFITDVTARVLAENATLAARLEFAVLRERQRISDDLHNVVIQHLFAAALAAKAADRSLGTERTRQLHAARESVLKSLEHLRQSVFALDPTPVAEALTQAIARVVRETVPPEEFRTSAHLIGPVKDIAPRVATELLAALAEGLRNVVKHAGASSVAITVAATDQRVSLRVADDGRGMGGAAHGSGITEILCRVEGLRGRCTWHGNRPCGAVMDWTAPR